jgi:hypothetical protein
VACISNAEDSFFLGFTPHTLDLDLTTILTPSVYQISLPDEDLWAKLMGDILVTGSSLSQVTQEELLVQSYCDTSEKD